MAKRSTIYPAVQNIPSGSVSNGERFGDNTELSKAPKDGAKTRSLSAKRRKEHVANFHEHDEKHVPFFQNGKEYDFMDTETHFDEEAMGKFETAPTYPSHTKVYKSWLRKNAPFKSNGESWLFIGIIAILMGLISFSIKLTVGKLHIFKFGVIRESLQKGEGSKLWLYYTGFSLISSLISSVIVVYVPSTSGSGVPELMVILNGVVIRKMLCVKVLFWKIISSVMSIVSTLPVGFEGPMIHIGSMVPTILTANYKCRVNLQIPENRYANDHVPGSGLRRFYLRISTRIRSDLCRARDGYERQVLACIGAASGVATAMKTPVAGLCFSMEEMSSNWSNTRTWQTLFCCVLACTVNEAMKAVLINSEAEHEDSADDPEHEIMHDLDIKQKLMGGIALMLPAMFLGVVGGISATLFIKMHLKITKMKVEMSKCLVPKVAKVWKIFDVFLTTVLFTSLVTLILQTKTCKTKNLGSAAFTCTVSTNESETDMGKWEEYREDATLFLNSWEQLIHKLFSRRGLNVFSPSSLSIVLVMIFIFSSLAGSANLSGGLMIPQLAIGALYGRIFGQLLQSFLKSVGEQTIPMDFMDPGLLSILGSASFFAGTSRLPITSVVMMVEMTGELKNIFAITVTVLTAKYVGDCLTESLYHSLIELKSMPFLDSELRVYWDRKRVNLEIFEAGNVMAKPVHCVEMIESVRALAETLVTTQHGAFPVVTGSIHSPMGLLGLISRMEIVILLCNLDTENINLDLFDLIHVDIDNIEKMYSEYNRDQKVLKNLEAYSMLISSYLNDARYKNLHIDLTPYLDTSTPRIPKSFSLERTYNLFRQLGLRHLVVVDDSNQVVGMITRKDLLDFVVQKRIHSLITESFHSAPSTAIISIPEEDSNCSFKGNCHSQSHSDENDNFAFEDQVARQVPLDPPPAI